MFARDSGKTKVKLGSDLTLNESYYINFVQLLHFLTQKAGKRHFTFFDWLVFFWHSLINSCKYFSHGNINIWNNLDFKANILQC